MKKPTRKQWLIIILLMVLVLGILIPSPSAHTKLSLSFSSSDARYVIYVGSQAYTSDTLPLIEEHDGILYRVCVSEHYTVRVKESAVTAEMDRGAR